MSDPVSLTSAAQRLRGWLRREDGTMTVLAVFVLVAMLLLAGVAVDTMRAEHERVRMQGATDRAVLAGTMLRPNVSGATPEQIAQAYLDAEGLGPYLQGRITVEQLPGGRRVTLAPAATLPTSFMRMVGVDEVTVATRAQAIERLAGGQPPEFEIVLVLDVTGSMGTMTSNGLTRIENLRNAATDLVNRLLEGRDPGEVALTIVPYSEYVLPPPGLLGRFINLPPGLSGACIDFQNWNAVAALVRQNVNRRNCDTSPWRTLRPMLHDAQTARDVIAGLQASGTTSVDQGVMFGAMFFDTETGGFIDDMIDNGSVHPAFAGQPFASTRPNTVRSMILMTDGENCCGGRFPVDQQDAQALSTCAALKDSGVTIYAVAFEAPQRGVDLMMGCASSPNHFFNTSAGGIADAFASVMNHIEIQSLRLTQ